MEIPIYLAMTAEEFSVSREKPPFLAWMACHFSPYGRGLVNLPPPLPKNAIVTVNDRIPWNGHDANAIAVQLKSIVCGGVLLDFQRDDTPASLVKDLVSALPCPTCVSHIFAKDTEGPVFLTPCPPHIPLTDHVRPWTGREIWLEAAQNRSQIRITENGAKEIPFCFAGQYPHADQQLACHYGIDYTDAHADFAFCRTADDLQNLAAQAQAFGVNRLIGLYQELK